MDRAQVPSNTAGDHFEPPFEECIANAHLIAAAPEMYEALALLVHFCDDPNGSEQTESLAMPSARAALRKARGEG